MSLREIDMPAIIDELVYQFADPMAFVRELVQNSIDAGTGEIEVDARLDVQGDEPVAVLSFRDWGEGMTRRIIEGKLVRLFSSHKDDDFTKIGRFGIGFVSVFAIEPEAVAIDTGRQGEYWRVLFSSDRTYELFELDYPTEGTWVRIYKPMSRDSFEKIKRDLKQTLQTWCKYAGVPIWFEGRDIREEMTIDSELTTTYQVEGTEIVMGFSMQAHSRSGYYNRGLTLREETGSPWPWACFKIDSRYLEHTLSRDQVLEDRHFSKATALLRELAEETLPKLLIDRLEDLAGSAGSEEQLETHYQYLAHYLKCGQSFSRSWRRREIFRTNEGETLSHRQVRRLLRRDQLQITDLKQGELARVFETDQQDVLLGGDGLRRALEQLFDGDVEIVEEKYLALPFLRGRRSTTARALQRSIERLLAGTEREIDELLLVGDDVLPAQLVGMDALVVPTQKGVIADALWRRPDCGDFADCMHKGHTLLINADAPLIRPYVEMARQKPQWAAVAVLESLFALGDDQLWSRAVKLRSPGEAVHAD